MFSCWPSWRRAVTCSHEKALASTHLSVSLFWVFHGVPEVNTVFLVSHMSWLQHTTASTCHSFLFVGTRALWEKRYNNLALIWICQSGNHGRWAAVFLSLDSLNIRVPQSKLFEMLSTVYDIILVKVLISPSLFSGLATWRQHQIMQQCPKVRMQQCPKVRLQQCSSVSVIFMFDASGDPDNLTLSL